MWKSLVERDFCANDDAMQTADTQTRIVDAAARLFHEQGFNGTGISTILREAEVNSGSLYHFYPSKEALLVAVLERYTHLLRPVVMDPVERATPDPVERIFTLFAQYRGWLAPIGFAQGCPIGNLALEIGDSSPAARDLIRQNFEGWYGCVRGWLEAAGDRLPPETDRGQLAVFVLTVLEGAIMQARAAQSPKPFDDSIAQLRGYFDLLLSRGAAGSGANRREHNLEAD